MKFTAVFLSFVWGANAIAAASGKHFEPYTYLNADARQRTDLNKHFAIETWDSKRVPVTDFSFDKDSELHMFSELKLLLETIVKKDGAGPEDALEFRCKKAHAVDFLYLDGESFCRELKEAIKGMVATAADACFLLEKPEYMGKSVPIAPIDPTKLTSLEAQVPVLLAPEVQLEFPSKMIPVDHAKLLRSALRKIFSSSFSDALDKGSAALNQASIKAGASGCSERLHASEDIAQLASELTSAAKFLRDSEAKGLKRQTNFVAELRRRSLCRRSLPVASLSDQERELFSLYYGALTWRNRGGGPWKLSGTQIARKTWAGIPFKLLATLNGSMVGEAVGDAMVDRLQLKGWSQWWDMGKETDDKYSDLMNMTERGVYQIGVGSYNWVLPGRSADTALKEEGVDTTAWQMAGMHLGPCYYWVQLGLATQWIGKDWPSPLVPFLDGNTSLGEVCAGAAFGYGLSKSLLSASACAK